MSGNGSSEEINIVNRFFKLIKVTDHCEDLLKGKIYCNSLQYFRKLEDFTGMADITEGGMILRYKVDDVPYETSVQLDETKIFLFCVSCMDLAMKEEGNTLGLYKVTDTQRECFLKYPSKSCVLIKDVDEFIDRIKHAVCKYRKSNDISFFHSLVTYRKDCYIENDVRMILERPYCVAFMKQKKYEWQREYRFVFEPGNHDGNNFVLEIGDCRDIMEMYPNLFAGNNGCFNRK